MMKEKGFTLVEIIVIVVILGIVAAVAVSRYLDLSRTTEKAVAESLVGSMRSALSLYFAQFVAKQKGTTQNFRDNVSIPNFMKVPGDSMGMTGSETLILEKRVTSRFTIDNPSSIKEYDMGTGGRYLRFVFKSGAILDIYYDRETPGLGAAYTGF